MFMFTHQLFIASQVTCHLTVDKQLMIYQATLWNPLMTQDSAHCTLSHTNYRQTHKLRTPTVPSMQYIYETTLLELLNCASLCSLTTTTTIPIVHKLRMVKL